MHDFSWSKKIFNFPQIPPVRNFGEQKLNTGISKSLQIFIYAHIKVSRLCWK